jgi:antitoxin ParD1/3/4
VIREPGTTGSPCGAGSPGTGFTHESLALREQRFTWQSLPKSLIYWAIDSREMSKELHMPTRNISLTPEQDEFVEKIVKAGEYQNASEAVRDALRALQQRRREDELRLKALRTHIKAGAEALRRGEFVEVDDAELDNYLEGLATVADRRKR